MTTKPDSAESVESKAKHLTEMILKGDHELAAVSAAEMSRDRSEVNDLIDTVSEAMNIVSDLHEIDRLSTEQVESCEKAAEKALEVLRPKIRVEQARVLGRVMVASLQGDPHSFDKTLLMAMLEIGGFTALDGGSDTSPQDLVEKIVQLEPDVLAVPLVTESAAKNFAVTAALLNSNQSPPKIVAFGRGATRLAELPQPVEEDTLGALSRIAELLILKG